MKEALAESYLQDSESETVEESTDPLDQADSDVVDVAADPLLTVRRPTCSHLQTALPCSCPCKEHSPRFESKNSQTVLPVNALDVCLLCAINRRRETSGAEVQVNLVRPVILSKSRRVSSGEGDNVDTLCTDQEGDPGQLSTPEPISRSLFAGEGPSTDSSSVDNHGE